MIDDPTHNFQSDIPPQVGFAHKLLWESVSESQPFGPAVNFLG